MAESATLHLDQLTRRFGRHTVVAGVSLSAQAGSSHLIVGPNGSGKSTIARLAVGLLRPHGGRVRIGAADPRVDPSARARLGYLGHQTSLYGDLTAVANLRFAAELAGLTDRTSRIEQCLDAVGVGAERSIAVRRLSRGMAQRVAIARSLLAEPSVIVWDEPLTGLDQGSVGRVATLISAERARGAAVVIISHDWDALWLADTSVHLIDRGRIVATESTATSLADFRRHYARVVG